MRRYPARAIKKFLPTAFLSFLLSISGILIGSPNGAPTEVCAANAAKGGFYILDWGPMGKDYVSGGTALIDWRDFEPEEGVYRWELLKNPQATYIPWLEVFNARLRNREVRIQQVPAQAVYSAHSAGKRIRLKLRVTEGAMPLWLYGGEDVNGKNPKSYGTTCGYPTYQEAWAGTPRCNAATDIVIAITMPLYPTKEDNAQPVWRNPIFQEKMKRVLKAIGDFVEKDPVYSSTVEFVEASVGSYGEMILYGKSDTFKFDTINQRMFRAAGYTNARYSEAVQKLIAAYMEVFPSFPIALSLGSGLYSGPYDDGSGVNSVPADVVPKVMSKYGSRIYLKFAGFGGNRADHTFRDYCPDKNRCISESFGGISQWVIDGYEFPFFCHAEKKRTSNCQVETPAIGADRLKKVLNYAVADKAYIVMMWYFDWRAIGDAPKNFKCADANGVEFNCANSDWGKFDQAFAQVFPQLQSLASVNPKPPSTYQLIINKEGTGMGDVAGNMIHCGSTCARAYPAGHLVTLTATSGAGSEFAGWTGDCLGRSPCALTMDRIQTVKAKFNLLAAGLPDSASNLFLSDTRSISPPGGTTEIPSNPEPSPVEEKTANSPVPRQSANPTRPADSNTVGMKLAAGAVLDLDGDGKDDVIWFDGEPGPVYAWYLRKDRYTKADIHRDIATPNWRMAGGGNL